MFMKKYVFHIYMKNATFFLQENFEDYLQTNAFFASILSSTSLNNLCAVFRILKTQCTKNVDGAPALKMSVGRD